MKTWGKSHSVANQPIGTPGHHTKRKGNAVWYMMWLRYLVLRTCDEISTAIRTIDDFPDFLYRNAFECDEEVTTKQMYTAQIVSHENYTIYDVLSTKCFYDAPSFA